MEIKNEKANGHVIGTGSDASIGQPDQKVNPWEPFSTNEKMRRSASQARFFDNNGGESKADGGGVVNHNGEYGPQTFGF